MSKTVSSDPAVITDEVIAANGQTANIVSIKTHAGTEVFSVDKDGNVTMQSLNLTNYGGHADYTIYQIGTITYARNDITSAIDYSGTNAATVIASVISALSATVSSKIYFKTGTYDLGISGIDIGAKNISMIGETSADGFGSGGMDGIWGVRFQYSGNGNAITIGDNSGTLNLRLQDFFVEATGAAKQSATAIGIKLDQVHHSILDNIGVVNFYGGVAIFNTGSISVYNRFERCFCLHNKVGLRLDAVTHAAMITGGAYVAHASTVGFIGIDIIADADENTFVGCDFSDGYYGVSNLGLNNTFIACRSEGCQTHFHIDPAAFHTQIIGHKFIDGYTYTDGPDPNNWVTRIDEFAPVRILDAGLQLLNGIPITAYESGDVTSRDILRMGVNNIVNVGSSVNMLALAGTGLYNDSGPLKHKIVGVGPVSTGAEALIDCTWSSPFADALYTVVASIMDATASENSLKVIHVESISTTKVQVRLKNDAAGDSYGYLHVIAIQQ